MLKNFSNNTNISVEYFWNGTFVKSQGTSKSTLVNNWQSLTLITQLWAFLKLILKASKVSQQCFPRKQVDQNLLFN